MELEHKYFLIDCNSKITILRTTKETHRTLKEKGIKVKDVVRVFNNRGQVLAGAILTDVLKQEIVKILKKLLY